MTGWQRHGRGGGHRTGAQGQGAGAWLQGTLDKLLIPLRTSFSFCFKRQLSLHSEHQGYQDQPSLGSTDRQAWGGLAPLFLLLANPLPRETLPKAEEEGQLCVGRVGTSARWRSELR